MPAPPANHDDDAPLVHGAAAVESISALTLVTADMATAVGFYEALGFRRSYGGPESSFTSFAVGANFLNLTSETTAPPCAGAGRWGRVIFYVSDVDAFYDRAVSAGLSPQFPPQDATWGERYFHLTDPDGHALSFARPLGKTPQPPWSGRPGP